MNYEFLLEIGTEEIPSGYLEQGLLDLKGAAERCFSENRIEVAGGFKTMGTPRRLVLTSEGVASAQQDVTEEVLGPPAAVSFDAKGAPTKAALGFAQRHGVEVKDLEVKKTAKGEYLFLSKRTAGRATLEVLSEVLPGLVASLPWPKVMRWGDRGFPFVRPIHWIVALLGGEVIPFKIAGIESSNQSRGHRFMSPEPFTVSGKAQYVAELRKRFVIVDNSERKAMVAEGVEEASRAVGGRTIKDEQLLETVANLVEYPIAMCGDIDSSFLALPEPVLITAMKKHQKYFAVDDGKGRLLPHFIAVNNTKVRDQAVVKRGNERVLRARLSDAEFFVKEDSKRPLLDRLQDLKGVLFQAGLGTSYQKVKRFTRLARALAEEVSPRLVRDAELVCSLCKCDLTTQIVGEFPELQGIMGRQYAMMEGYSQAVCDAIAEHYLPSRAGDTLPGSDLGALVGISDRMDTIAGFFALHMEPTGSADPFALRRHAIAVLRILDAMDWNISLKAISDMALKFLSEEIGSDASSVSEDIMAFFRERLKFLSQREGYDADLFEAAAAAGFHIVPEFWARLKALKEFASESSEFQSLVRTCKRVGNILKKETVGGDVAPELFREECEKELWKKFVSARDDVGRFSRARNYRAALYEMAELRAPVDRFFQEVEVLVKDNEPLRANRTALLKAVEGLFLSVADFGRFPS
jgi:glycyl-tRNA synthetase beta chain